MINYNTIKNIEGWCSLDKMTTMFDLIVEIKPQKIVEIGVFCGKSLIVQALALKNNQKGIIIGIDSWNNNDCIKEMKTEIDIQWWKNIDLQKCYLDCLNNINKFDVKDYVKIHKDTSENVVSLIQNEIDILHIDGNHETENACKDVMNYVPKIKTGGYLFFDDAGWKRTQKAINTIEREFKMKLITKIKSDEENNFCSLYKKI